MTQLMGGEVTLDSTEGVGSEFSVILDFALGSPQALALPEASPTAPHERALVGVRVLVVDDSDTNREVTKRILELSGARVRLSSNGLEAFEQLRGEPQAIDVVLMDVQMPTLDGHDATRRIRRDLGLTDLPIIALTAGALSSERRRAADAGMDGFIIKPFDAEALVRSILQHVKPAHDPLAQPLSGEPAPGEAVTAWPEIDGIDSSDVRARLGGDVELFGSMLRRLLVEFSDVTLPSGSGEPSAFAAQAKRMHKLRGSAGMLGARNLQHLAGEAEAAWVAGDIDRAAPLERRLAMLLDRLGRHALPKLDAQRPRALDPSSPSEDELDPQLLADLIDLLRQQNLSAQARFTAIASQLRRRLGQESYQLALHHMAHLQFADAIKLLEEVPGAKPN